MNNKYTPPTDILEDETSILVFIDLPGIDYNNTNIYYDSKAFTILIQGHKKNLPTKNLSKIKMQRYRGEIKHKIELPKDITIKCYKHEFKNGVMKIILEKILSNKIYIPIIRD